MTRQNPHQLRFDDLPTRKATQFSYTPGKAECEDLARSLGIQVLRKMQLSGSLAPRGPRDWTMKAHLSASVIQACVISLDPVTTRIEEDLTRIYSADYRDPEGDELELGSDVDMEPLPAVIDLREVALEALRLVIPAYPRAEGAELGELTVTEPGREPLRDEDLKPFAGLADLMVGINTDNGDD